MDAQTIYSFLKPHLERMEPQEKESLSNLIAGIKEKKRNFQGKRKVISLAQAKKKIIDFRKREMEGDKPS